MSGGCDHACWSPQLESDISIVASYSPARHTVRKKRAQDYVASVVAVIINPVPLDRDQLMTSREGHHGGAAYATIQRVKSTCCLL